MGISGGGGSAVGWVVLVIIAVLAALGYWFGIVHMLSARNQRLDQEAQKKKQAIEDLSMEKLIKETREINAKRGIN